MFCIFDVDHLAQDAPMGTGDDFVDDDDGAPRKQHGSASPEAKDLHGLLFSGLSLTEDRMTG